MSDLITLPRATVQQALEALKLAIGVLSDENEAESTAVRASIKAIKTALAEPEQEPVYWEYKHVDDGLERWNRVVPRTGQTLETAAAEIHGYRRGLKRPYEVRALYTHPPRREWQGLSEEEFGYIYVRSATHEEFGRGIEQALRSKNHG